MVIASTSSMVQCWLLWIVPLLNLFQHTSSHIAWICVTLTVKPGRLINMPDRRIANLVWIQWDKCLWTISITVLDSHCQERQRHLSTNFDKHLRCGPRVRHCLMYYSQMFWQIGPWPATYDVQLSYKLVITSFWYEFNWTHSCHEQGIQIWRRTACCYVATQTL